LTANLRIIGSGIVFMRLQSRLAVKKTYRYFVAQRGLAFERYDVSTSCQDNVQSEYNSERKKCRRKTRDNTTRWKIKSN
jgi:hypothetical protein